MLFVKEQTSLIISLDPIYLPGINIATNLTRTRNPLRPDQRTQRRKYLFSFNVILGDFCLNMLLFGKCGESDGIQIAEFRPNETQPSGTNAFQSGETKQVFSILATQHTLTFVQQKLKLKNQKLSFEQTSNKQQPAGLRWQRNQTTQSIPPPPTQGIG